MKSIAQLLKAHRDACVFLRDDLWSDLAPLPVSSGIHCRPVQPDDHDGLRALVQSDEPRPQIVRLLLSGRSAFVACASESPVATAVYMQKAIRFNRAIIHRLQPHETYMAYVYVHPEYRDHAALTTLTQFLRNYWRGHGKRVVYALVNENNLKGLAAIYQAELATDAYLTVRRWLVFTRTRWVRPFTREGLDELIRVQLAGRRDRAAAR